jgi:hypothetical protein
MMRRALLSGIVLLAGLAWSESGHAQQLVTCESNDGHQRFCPADTRGGVHVRTQLSRAACREGVSWGYDSHGIWTANGCRAAFEVGPSYRDAPGSSDSSRNNAAAAVAAAAILAAGAAAVHREHERDRRQQAAQNDAYNYQGYGYQGYPNYQPPPPAYVPRYPDAYTNSYTPVRCESNEGRMQYCPADVRRGRVELTRRLSRGECRFGQNWGYDSRAIWVNQGCRAEFVVLR